MKFGYQTIIFGSRIDDLDWALQSIARAGFQGVEFCQRHEMICIQEAGMPSPRAVALADLAVLLQKYGLTFLGMADGTLEERIQFCSSGADELKRMGISEEYYRPRYLYVDSISVEETEMAARHDFNLALHPHVFMPLDDVDTALALPEAQRDHVYFMPDTAHIYIAGDDPISEIRKLKKDKVTAVHLKDWDSAYGRSRLRYAKGFVPLGAGEVPLKEVVAVLHEMNYDGWIVAEQDYSRQSPVCAILQAAEWLSRSDLKLGFPTGRDTLDLDCSEGLHPLSPANTVMDAELARAVLQAETCSLNDCYAALSKVFYQRYNACHVSLWSSSPTSNDICLISSYPPDLLTDEEPPILEKGTSLIGLAAETRAVQKYKISDIQQQFPGRKIAWSGLAARVNAEYGVSVPVPIRFNPHHIRYVVGLLLKDQQEYQYDNEAMIIADALSRASDFALEDDCAFASGKVNTIANETIHLIPFLDRLTHLIKNTLECQGVSIFLTNITRTQLSCQATTGIEWLPTIPTNAHFYTRADQGHPTVSAWAEKKTLLIGNAFREKFAGEVYKWRSHEAGSDVDETNDNILLIPICSLSKKQHVQQIEVIGVIRCRNKQQPLACERGTIHRLFTDDDIALLDAICQTATPHIELRQSHEQRLRAISHITHELKAPVNSLRGELDLFRYWTNKKLPSVLKSLPIDHFDNLFALTNVAVRVVNNATLYGLSGDALRVKAEPTWMMGDIVAPVRDQMRYLAQEQELPPEAIQYSTFESIPRLYVDRNQFQQVFFNLFSNAIKYALPEPTQFSVKVDAVEQDGYYRIACNDLGVGIDPKYAPYIFEEGVRGPVEQARHVEGLGLGLYVVRRIIEAHGGYVDVEHYYDPTTIAMYLPLSLRSGPPKQPK